MTEWNHPDRKAPKAGQPKPGRAFGVLAVLAAALLHAVVWPHCKKGGMNPWLDPRAIELFPIA